MAGRISVAEKGGALVVCVLIQYERPDARRENSFACVLKTVQNSRSDRVVDLIDIQIERHIHGVRPSPADDGIPVENDIREIHVSAHQ